MLHATNLTVNHLKNPAGVTQRPRFGWIIESDSSNTKQKSYRLQIALDGGFRDTVFDSQNVRGEASINVAADLTMESATKYFWRVKITDNHDGMSLWSDAAYFITGILDDNDWHGDFVTAETIDDIDNSKGTYVRGPFAVNGEIRSAYLFCTSLGLHKPYLNGTRVGDGELLPGWTSYHHRLMYQTYEVGGLLHQGENVIGAMLGAGWYKGTMGFIGTRNNYGDRTAFFAMLLITYADGRTQRVSSDDSWLGADAPVVFSEIYDGEIYDARLELDGWCEPGRPSGSWRRTCVVGFDRRKLFAQAGCVVKPIEPIPVQRIITTPQGDTVLDFGQNLTGWVHFSVQGKAGDRVELNCFEVLDKDGNAYFDNLRAARQTLIYDCKDDRPAEYHPHFSFQGFRYVRVASYPGEIQPRNFTAFAVYSDMPMTGTFECSNADINQLHHNILWGMKGNFVDVPTDCPQRDERLGWTGDAQIFCQTAGYLMDTYVFFDKWLKDLAADQTEDGGVAHVVPDLLTGQQPNDWLLSQGTHSAAGWADAAVIMPWTLYLTYGDKTVLEEQYASMKGWVDFMTAHARDGIWNYKLQFGDWLALDAAEDSYFGATPIELTNTAYYAYSTGLFAKAARVLGKHDDAARYQALYDGIVGTFRDRFYSQDGTMNVQTQTAHILALHFRLVPPAFVNQAVQGLLELLKKENGHLVTGFMGTSYFCQTLSEYGCVEEAYDLLLKNDFPSWLYQVKMGATTIWEHWDSLKPDGSMWSADMNSFNHYAYGAVGEWLYRTVAGIEAVESAPGFRKAMIYPRMTDKLEYVKARLETVHGTLGVAWNIENEVVRLAVTVPHNTTATIRLDNAASVIEGAGLRFVPEDGYFAAEAGSGHYQITFVRQD